MALSLEKKTELVRIQLAKNNIPEGLIMQVKMQLDVSGSFQSDYQNGTINELVNRLIPLAMRFDDNGSLEAYAFSSRAVKTSDVTASDFDSYISKKFLNDASKVLWLGTKYSTALQLLKEDIAPKKSFLGSLFGGKKQAAADNVPNFVMFITDGENDGNDEKATENLLAEFAERKTYVQMIGVGYGFTFLDRMKAKFPHVGFVNFTNIAGTSDESMYEKLLDDKLCNWIKAQ